MVTPIVGHLCDPEEVWRLGCLVVVASCGFAPKPGADDGLPHDATVDAIDGPPGDVDGDGIPNGADNCPSVANPLQENEDGDDRGDACDLCPHLAGTVPGTDGDDDGDGIGNQCDPRVGIDRRVVFLPFNDPAELQKLAIRGGSNSWTISGGRLHQNDTSLATPQNIVWTGESITGDVFVQGKLHIEALAAGAGTRLAAVVGAYDDSGTVDAYACGVRSPDAAQQAVSTSWHFDQPPAFDQQTLGANVGLMAAGLQAAETLKATITVPDTDSTLACFAGTTPAPVGVPGFVPVGFPGVRTLGVTASFDYLFVVAIGIP